MLTILSREAVVERFTRAFKVVAIVSAIASHQPYYRLRTARFATRSRCFRSPVSEGKVFVTVRRHERNTLGYLLTVMIHLRVRGLSTYHANRTPN